MTVPPSPQPEPTPPPGTPGAEPPRSTPVWRAWAAAAAVAVVVVGVGITVINRGSEDTAAGDTTEQDTETDGTSDPRSGLPGGFGGGAAGEVTAIDDMTFTVESSDPTGTTSTVTVLATSETTVRENVEGTLDDLSVGDAVVVTGEETDSGLEASSITEGQGTFGAGGPGRGGPPEGFEPPAGGELPEDFEPPEGFDPPAGGGPPQGGVPGGGFTTGEIVEIDGSSITIEADDGETTTVTITDSTTVTVSEARSLADIEVGDTIRATPDPDAESDDEVVTATSIQLGDLGLGRFGGGADGETGS